MLADMEVLGAEGPAPSPAEFLASATVAVVLVASATMVAVLVIQPVRTWCLLVLELVPELMFVRFLVLADLVVGLRGAMIDD
jgi:hypothetical protein